VLLVLLAGVRMAAQWASLIILATTLVVAVVVYGMPIGLALDSTLLGVAFGLFPIVERTGRGVHGLTQPRRAGLIKEAPVANLAELPKPYVGYGQADRMLVDPASIDGWGSEDARGLVVFPVKALAEALEEEFELAKTEGEARTADRTRIHSLPDGADPDAPRDPGVVTVRVGGNEALIVLRGPEEGFELVGMSREEIAALLKIQGIGHVVLPKPWIGGEGGVDCFEGENVLRFLEECPTV
jgi:hypothetical protein